MRFAGIDDLAIQVGDDIDGVTGATYTSRAVAQATRNGSQTSAAKLL